MKTKERRKKKEVKDLLSRLKVRLFAEAVIVGVRGGGGGNSI